MAFLDYAGLSRFKDKIQALLNGKKNTQSAVSDPTASGTGVTFIDTISQDAQGVITPTKKTVRTMGAASSSADGTTGLVPAPAAGKQAQFLRGDGTWDTPTNTKNTAGATDSSSKLFLIGATAQDASPQTYSHDTAYVGTDGCLYSGGNKVLTSHQDISGKKNTQSAVSDPTASGTGVTFIDTISQDAQGVITPTKKTVRTMGAASSSAAGTTGLVPAPAAGKQASFLRGDGQWAVPAGTTYEDATQYVHGLMSATDKQKLDGVAAGATANVVSDSLSDTSTTNALSAAQGKVLNDHIEKIESSGIDAVGYHLGFYRDENGDLCEYDEEEE